jgi:membrane associated rhomboid family serine protease
VNALVFVLELGGGEAFVTQWSVIPVDVAAGRHMFTIATAMFMHAGWLHIVGNMVFLWAFGPEIEDAMGRPRYLSFYLLSGLVASVAQIAAMPGSTVPNLGASGAIAGVMGAFLITYPRDQIRTLVMFGFFIRITVIPAGVLIGLWFVIQLFSQLGAMADVQATVCRRLRRSITSVTCVAEPSPATRDTGSSARIEASEACGPSAPRL